MKLSTKTQSFVMHFGEMGSKWGFNRTVGQMIALMVIHEKALSADEIAEALSISRGNVSMGIKELQSWRLVQVQHIPGDRKDYYTTVGDLWQMARTVFEERMKREVEPTLSLLRSQLMDSADNDKEAYALQQMQEIHDLIEMLTQWSASLNSLKPETLQSVMKLGAGVTKVLEFKNKFSNSEK
ncbi:GbsR/MarR family transcriptional regulator [Catenovulum maritimum]|uniref:HTH-type transcriptional regulator n=1 Tax=Catenovulum maritimum TaxID=1513271 RepID=A0A0J8GSZ0_9ALTE|nr:GbsR/MarR family transcriptional regulator [Catenovulum maritimum]KMT65872.1 ArsR family transcriptional regulator [Catenovulum maritimum]